MTTEKNIAKELKELFKAAGGIRTYPFVNGAELAHEELEALECGMSTALVVATELAKGRTEGMTIEEVAIRMKVTAMNMYIEEFVLADEWQEGEDGHGEE